MTDFSFSCRMDNVKTISDVLNCLCVDVHKDQPCQVEVTQEAIVFVVTGRAKSTQARISLQSDLFEEFLFEALNPIRFVLNLTILIDCLHLFGLSSETVSGSMSYASEDAIFKLSLEEGGVVTTCDISSLYCDDLDEIEKGLFAAFRNSSEECQIILKSEPLKESIQELTDSHWAGSVQVEVCNAPAFMKLTSGGTLGMSEVNFPRSSDVFISFRCSSPTSNSYSLKSMLLGMKALNVAKETYVRINSEGIMCIQHQIETSNGQDIFFDFLMVADETEINC